MRHVRLFGRAAVYDTPYRDFQKETFWIAPGAFKPALVNPVVALVINHDYRRKLAAVDEGTLVISEDIVGLLFEAEIDTREWPWVADLAREGKLRVSTGKIRVRAEYRNDRRTIVSCDLEEVSLIVPPTTPKCSETWAVLDSPASRARGSREAMAARRRFVGWS